MVVEADVAEWIYAQVEAQGTVDRDMEGLEKAVGAVTREARRRVFERLTQEAAAREEFGCPTCGEMLNVVRHHQGRTVDSTFGLVCFERSYGLCPRCGRYCFPADVAPGLHERALSSPRVQETCALMDLAGARRSGRRGCPAPLRLEHQRLHPAQGGVPAGPAGAEAQTEG